MDAAVPVDLLRPDSSMASADDLLTDDPASMAGEYQRLELTPEEARRKTKQIFVARVFTLCVFVVCGIVETIGVSVAFDDVGLRLHPASQFFLLVPVWTSVLVLGFDIAGTVYGWHHRFWRQQRRLWQSQVIRTATVLGTAIGILGSVVAIAATFTPKTTRSAVTELCQRAYQRPHDATCPTVLGLILFRTGVLFALANWALVLFSPNLYQEVDIFSLDESDSDDGSRTATSRASSRRRGLRRSRRDDDDTTGNLFTDDGSEEDDLA